MATAGLVLHQVRSSAPSRRDEWEDWLDEVHLPDLAMVPAVRVVTRFSVVPEPPPGMPGLGFSTVLFIELDDGPDAASRVGLRLGELHREGRIHPNHAIVRGEVLAPHGEFATKRDPDDELRGHVLAEVLCVDPARTAEWDRWYDATHVPDMMASGAFRGATRWRRVPEPDWGAGHLTLYDVSLPDVTDAVARSAAIMPDLIARGGKHPAHCGGLTMALQAAGRWAGAGCRGATR